MVLAGSYLLDVSIGQNKLFRSCWHSCRYEMLLYEKLRDLGISYQSEDDLRAAGFSKTPDVKLDAPIGVRGRMVNWIDSKASFGDEHIHKSQGSDQFQRYLYSSQVQ